MDTTDLYGLGAIVMTIATILKVVTDARTGFTGADVSTIVIMAGTSAYYWYLAINHLLGTAR